MGSQSSTGALTPMYQLSVFVHLVSAIVWIGGMLFLALVIVPVARNLPPDQRAALLGSLGRRFRVVGWICIVLLATTGLLNAGFRGVTWEGVLTGRILGSWFGQLLTVKVVLVAAIVGLSIVHDFIIGPASVGALERRSPVAADEATRLRRQASRLGRLNTILALLVVAIAVSLVRGLPW